MTISPQGNLEIFHFREIHPCVFIGTASDRYAGWIGQIYSPDRYTGRVTSRPRIVAGTTFVEEVLARKIVENFLKENPTAPKGQLSLW